MDIKAAQADLRRAYRGGGPGAIISGIVWAVAGVVAHLHGINAGFATLFFGGMLIFPIGTLLVHTIGKVAGPDPENPQARIVVETVPPMIAMLIAAWLFIPFRPDLVFPLAAIAVGTHYFGFRSAYGMMSYWVLAAIMTIFGALAVFVFPLPATTVIFAIAVIEIAFGIYITARHRTPRNG